MEQIASGFRAILSNAAIYSGFQWLMGADSGRRDLVARYIKIEQGMKILDIGCGPAEILDYLPPVDYWGFDISRPYINQATKRFGNRGKFICKDLTIVDLHDLPKFDVVLCIGLLHHLADSTALKLIELASNALKPNGRLYTIDGCLDSSQNMISKLLVRYDRGQHVRTVEGYLKLTGGSFPNTTATLRHQRWIPYTHCVMECAR